LNSQIEKKMIKSTGILLLFSGVFVVSSMVAMESNILIPSLLQSRQTGLKRPGKVKTEITKIIKKAENDAIETVIEKNVSRFTKINFKLFPEKTSEIYQKQYAFFLCAYGYWKLFLDATKDGQISILPHWFLNPATPLEYFQNCQKITVSAQDSVYYSIVKCPEAFTFEQLDNLVQYASKNEEIQKIELQDNSLSNTQLSDLIEKSNYRGLLTFQVSLTRRTPSIRYNSSIFTTNNSLYTAYPTLEQIKNILEKNQLYAKILVFTNRDDCRPSNSMLKNFLFLGEETLVFKLYVNLLDLSIQCGANPNIQYLYGTTVLLKALQLLRMLPHPYYVSKTTKIITLLLQCGGDPNISNDSNEVPLYYSIITNNIKIAKLLFQYGANPNKIQYSQGGCFILSDLFSRFHLTFTQKKALKFADLFLKCGMDPNKQNLDGKTALYYAIVTNNVDLVTLLLRYNVDLSLRCDEKTAIEIARFWGATEIISLLGKHQKTSL
jgi:hypothetical protein